MHNPHQREGHPDSTMFIVPMVTAQLVDDATGEIYAVTGNVTTVGRGDMNKICIPEPSISRTHCRIERISSGYQLVDRESTNGTYVNGHRVARTTLHNGDAVRMGTLALRFETNAE